MKILFNTNKRASGKTLNFKILNSVKSFKLTVGIEGQEFRNSLKPTDRNIINVKINETSFFLSLSLSLSMPHEVHRPSYFYSDVKEFRQRETPFTYIKPDFELFSGCRRSHLTLGVTIDTFSSVFKSPVCTSVD